MALPYTLEKKSMVRKPEIEFSLVETIQQAKDWAEELKTVRLNQINIFTLS